MERVSLDDLAAATGGILSEGAQRLRLFDGVSIDSRRIMPGHVFWAIRGPRFDGHDFVEEAFGRGAIAAVVEKPLSKAAGPTVSVENCVEALGRFATWYRSLLDAFVIGVTGSVGKTTTRELVFAALGGQPVAVHSQRNYNNLLGVPLTLLDGSRRHRFAVVEMGADRVGDIAALCRIARPEIGIITWLGVAHVETFGSEEAIVQAKGELVESLPPSGLALLPGDQTKARTLAVNSRANVAFIGTGGDNTCHVRASGFTPGKLAFTVDEVPFEVKANGRHFATPAGMAVVVARRLGRTDAQISEGLKTFEPIAGRCRIAITSPWTVIDDTYNANPDSMRAAIDTLAEWPTKGRRVLVCGDMYGLGGGTANAHIELGRTAALRGIDLIVAIGNHARHVADGVRREGVDARRAAVFSDRQAAAVWLTSSLREGDVVWVKASRPLRLEMLIDELAMTARGATGARRAAA